MAAKRKITTRITTAATTTMPIGGMFGKRSARMVEFIISDV
jgi:hypothetical protein